MRGLPKAVGELRAKDPETCISVCVLRRWAKEGKVKSVKTGKNFLVNMDTLERYMEGVAHADC